MQEAYRSIFFAGQSPTKADADSPRAATGQAQDEYEEQLMEEWKIRQHNFSSMVARHSKSDDQTRARLQRADVIERLRRKFRVLAYRLGGQDWQSLFDSYDRDGTGGLDMDEFIQVVRKDAEIPEQKFSDTEVRHLFSTIDTDGNGTIKVEEFTDWLKNPLKKERPRRARSDLAAHKEVIKQEEAYMDSMSTGTPFIAEYIALHRCSMTEGPDEDSSARIGWLQKGEVVAVTQVWGKYRLWIHRLRWNARPSSGWVSCRNRGGQGEVLLERLPVEEWSARSYHETAVAQRVATLRSMYEVYEKTRKSSAANQHPLVMPPEWIDERFNLQEPGKLAARKLRTMGALQSEALLDALEKAPRSTWKTLLAGWENWEEEDLVEEKAKKEREKERERLAQREEEQRRKEDEREEPLRLAQPHPPSSGGSQSARTAAHRHVHVRPKSAAPSTTSRARTSHAARQTPRKTPRPAFSKLERALERYKTGYKTAPVARAMAKAEALLEMRAEQDQAQRGDEEEEEGKQTEAQSEHEGFAPAPPRIAVPASRKVEEPAVASAPNAPRAPIAEATAKVAQDAPVKAVATRVPEARVPEAVATAKAAWTGGDTAAKAGAGAAATATATAPALAAASAPAAGARSRAPPPRPAGRRTPRTNT